MYSSVPRTAYCGSNLSRDTLRRPQELQRLLLTNKNDKAQRWKLSSTSVKSHNAHRFWKARTQLVSTGLGVEKLGMNRLIFMKSMWQCEEIGSIV